MAIVDAMLVLYRALLVLGLLLLTAGACVVWNVYGAWPVPEGYEFPRHSLWGGGPTALFEGELIAVDGCIRTAGDDGYTVVWPPGFSLSIDDEEPVVHGIGQDARMGDTVRLVGGSYTRDQLGGVVSAAAETRCPGPFILTTGFAD